MRRRAGRAVAARRAVLVVAAPGCAIPTQGAPSTIAPSKVPFNLLEPAPAHDDDHASRSRRRWCPVKVFFLNPANQLQPGAARRAPRRRR